MAKVVKDTREVIDVNEELEKIEKENTKKKKVKKQEEKKDKKKVEKTNKKSKKQLGIITFFKEVRHEVSKIKWPSKKDMVKYSLATICFILFFALFFYGIMALMSLVQSLV